MHVDNLNTHHEFVEMLNHCQLVLIMLNDIQRICIRLITKSIDNMNVAHELETSNTKREINLGNISKNVMIVSGNDESAFAMSNTPTILLNQSIQNLISTSLTKPHKRCVSNIQSSGNIFLENPFTGTFDLKKSMELSNRKQKNNRSDVHQKKAIRSMQRNLLKNKASVKNILDSNL